MDPFDLVIIGTGSAARSVAMKVREAGWTVAVVDDKPFGGTCPLRGCDPKKVLVAGAEAVDFHRRMRGHGLVGDARIDWPDLIAFKRAFTDPFPEKQERMYADAGVRMFHGPARFTGRTSLDVGGVRLEGRRILIAAGAEPVPLGIEGEEHLATSEDFLNLPHPPRRIVFVGGGYIAAEFSFIAARAGAQVTVLQRGPRLLKRFDQDLVEQLMASFRTAGIDVRTGMAVSAIKPAGQGFRVEAASDGGPQTFEADLVVHAAGRGPALDRLGTDAAGLERDHHRLKLNEHLRSVSNPAVYAAGDAAQAGPPLTPVAGHDGRVVAANLLEGDHAKPNYTGVPSVAFTLPPIAAVGLGEEEARRSGIRCRVKSGQASGWYTARRVSEPVYGYKTLVEEETGRLLGAHLVGPHADEVINVFALAIRHGLTAEAVRSTMFAYPTTGSDIAYML